MSTCADCGAALVDHLDEGTTEQDTTDVYVCYDPQESQRVIEVLRAAGIDPLVRDRGSTAFPLNVGTESQKLIAVTREDAERARPIVEAAIQDGVLVGEGKVVAP
jgi:hypothetical protein